MLKVSQSFSSLNYSLLECSYSRAYVFARNRFLGQVWSSSCKELDKTQVLPVPYHIPKVALLDASVKTSTTRTWEAKTAWHKYHMHMIPVRRKNTKIYISSGVHQVYSRVSKLVCMPANAPEIGYNTLLHRRKHDKNTAPPPSLSKVPPPRCSV